MGLFLGMDGGGTKTEAAVCDENGVILGRGMAGPSNPITNGKEAALTAMKEATRLAVGGLESAALLDYAAVCIPGIYRYRGEIEIPCLRDPQNISISGDAQNAYCSAVAQPFGIVVLSGTGSFAAGVNRKGERLELGGWGPVLGDEGSGYHMGIACLKAVIAEYEQTGVKTLLTPKVMDFFGVKDVQDIRHTVYSPDFDKREISRLSLAVEEAALEGDRVALQIIREAAEALAALACGILRRLEMNDGEYDVVLTGGISNLGKRIEEPFAAYIRSRHPNVRIRKPRFKPVVGSLLIAMSI